MKKLPEFKFMECESCKAKLGSPILCTSCLNNQSAIYSLKRRHKVWAKQRGIELVQTLGMDDWSIMPRLEEMSHLAKNGY